MAWLDLFRRNKQVLKTPEERHLDRAGQALRWAARWGNLRRVKRMVEKWGDSKIIESKNRNGQTALHVAVLNKRFGIVQYLVESAGADVEAVAPACRLTRRGRLSWKSPRETAIHMAVRTGSLKIVQYLVETAHASVEAKGPKDRTALLWAIYHRQSIDMVKYLVTSCGADVEAKDSRRHTAILLAVARNCSFRIIQYLVESCHANVRAKNIDREDAYELARNLFRSDEKKQLFFEAHRDSVERVVVDGRTLLLQAVKEHKLDDARRLVEVRHANVKATDTYGNTALLLAVKERQRDIADYLVASTRVAVEARDYRGKDALSLAVERGDAEMVFLLAKSGCCTVSTATLHRAVQFNKCNVVRALIEAGAVNVDVTDSVGDTILHVAVRNENFDMVQCLVKKCNANVEAKLGHGGTALHSAIESRRPNEMVRYLVEEGGADVEATNAAGETALLVAVRNNQFEMVGYFVKKCNANVKTKLSALHIAIEYECSKNMVRYLVEEGGADVEVTNKDGDTVLLLATRSYCRNAVGHIKYLVESARANANVLSEDGQRVLNVAVHNAFIAELDLCCLVERGNANVEGTNAWGETPLFSACQRSRVDLVQWLIRAGQANIVTMNDERKTVFHGLVGTSSYRRLHRWKILR